MTNPAEGGEGFEQAKGALHQAEKKTQWINQQVSEGKLRLNPEAAEAAAKQCEETVAKVRLLRMKLNNARAVEGLGDYRTSLDLRHHFEQKVSQEGSGGVALLDQLQRALRDEADAYRNAAKDYRVTDEQIADDLRKGQK